MFGLLQMLNDPLRQLPARFVRGMLAQDRTHLSSRLKRSSGDTERLRPKV
jgi:hypothetical protein